MTRNDLTARLALAEVVCQHEDPAINSRLVDLVKQGLDQLAEELDRPKPQLARRSGVLLGQGVPAHLPPDLRARAEALYLRLWHAGGAGKHMVEAGLLATLGCSADPASIPFWREVVDLGRVGDTFASKRHELAIAAVAHTALHHPASDALEALRSFTGHQQPGVRGYAVEALAQISISEDGALDPAVAEVIRRVATTDPAFEPRFIARQLLMERGAPPQVFDKDDVVAFRVKLGRASRTIELRARQPLAELHRAILYSFNWDFDHLHAFYLNGDQRDARFTIPADDGCEDEDLPLGVIGFTVGHRFIYLYDFGDSNIFEIRVVRTSKAARGVKYPRVIEERGESPPQYSYE